MTYILLMRNTRYWLVGPFESRKAAGKWGAETQIEGHDDPRWQVIDLEPAGLGAPKVFSPDDIAGIENGEPD